MGNTRARPNFFIVGAPKSGTTALYTYLAAHPDVLMSSRKEPSYFAIDLDEGTAGADRWFVRDLDGYLELFSGWRGEPRVGEASTMYLQSTEAARLIQQFEPRARVIAVLRNPVDTMYALHAQKFKVGGEELRDFADALAAEGARREGRLVPKYANPKTLQYREVVSYASQVRRYLDTFRADQVLVLIFEDFVANPAAAYGRICEFLDIDATHQPSFAAVNESGEPRSLAIRNLLRSHPKRLFGRRPPRLLRQGWRAVKPALQSMNTRVSARPPLDPRLRASLVAELAPDVARLSELLNRDLTTLWGFSE